MIELKNLSKYYGLTRALEGVTCTIQKGEIIGFVGPNGAGKSTAMKIITTYTAPTSGTAKVGGFDVMENPREVRNLIGYLPETVPLYADMLVREYLEFIGEARHLNGSFKKRYDWVVEACGLQSVLKRKIGVLSKGYKQRTCLAQALIHDPEVLILDEPTSGLDPLQIIGIRNLIKSLAHEKTIVLSTHILPEVATVADRILVINEGKLVADGTFDDLVEKVTDRQSLYLVLEAQKKEVETAFKSLPGLLSLDFDSGMRGKTGCHVRYRIGQNPVERINEIVRSNRWNILEFQQEKISLEESFIRLTRTTEKREDTDKKTKGQKGGAE